MNDYGKIEAKHPEHLSIASQFANEIMDRFNPSEVNEVLHHIKIAFKERRGCEIADLEKKLAYLKDSAEGLV